MQVGPDRRRHVQMVFDLLDKHGAEKVAPWEGDLPPDALEPPFAGLRAAGFVPVEVRKGAWATGDNGNDFLDTPGGGCSTGVRVGACAGAFERERPLGESPPLIAATLIAVVVTVVNKQRPRNHTHDHDGCRDHGHTATTATTTQTHKATQKHRRHRTTENAKA
jgi:hypothetical protein